MAAIASTELWAHRGEVPVPVPVRFLAFLFPVTLLESDSRACRNRFQPDAPRLQSLGRNDVVRGPGGHRQRPDSSFPVIQKPGF